MSAAKSLEEAQVQVAHIVASKKGEPIADIECSKLLNVPLPTVRRLLKNYIDVRSPLIEMCELPDGTPAHRFVGDEKLLPSIDGSAPAPTPKPKKPKSNVHTLQTPKPSPVSVPEPTPVAETRNPTQEDWDQLEKAILFSLKKRYASAGGIAERLEIDEQSAEKALESLRSKDLADGNDSLEFEDSTLYMLKKGVAVEEVEVPGIFIEIAKAPKSVKRRPTVAPAKPATSRGPSDSEIKNIVLDILSDGGLSSGDLTKALADEAKIDRVNARSEVVNLVKAGVIVSSVRGRGTTISLPGAETAPAAPSKPASEPRAKGPTAREFKSVLSRAKKLTGTAHADPVKAFEEALDAFEKLQSEVDGLHDAISEKDEVINRAVVAINTANEVLADF